MAKHKINPREINKLLDPKHVDAFVQAYQQAFGEHSFLPYTGINENYTQKQDSEAFKLLKISPNFSELSNQVKRQLKASPKDFFNKDLAMIVLQPIGLAIEGSLQMIIGLIKILSNIPAALQKKDHDMLLGMSQTWLGVSILLLAAVAPLGRMFHAATRAYASVVDPKGQDQDLGQRFGMVDLFNSDTDSEFSEYFQRIQAERSDDESEYSDDPRAGLVAYMMDSYKKITAEIRGENSEKPPSDDKTNKP